MDLHGMYSATPTTSPKLPLVFSNPNMLVCRFAAHNRLLSTSGVAVHCMQRQQMDVYAAGCMRAHSHSAWT